MLLMGRKAGEAQIARNILQDHCECVLPPFKYFLFKFLQTSRLVFNVNPTMNEHRVSGRGNPRGWHENRERAKEKEKKAQFKDEQILLN